MTAVTWIPDGLRWFALRAGDDSRVLGADDLARLFGRADPELAASSWSWCEVQTFGRVLPEQLPTLREAGLVGSHGWRVPARLVRRLIGLEVTVELLAALGATPPPATVRPDLLPPQGNHPPRQRQTSGLPESEQTGIADAVIERLLTALPFQGTTAPAEPPPFMSVDEYARHGRISSRTVRYLVKEMAEGVHFHRDGREGRRVLIHVRDADAFRAARKPRQGQALTVAQLAIDEVTRRRARVALKRRQP